MAISMTGAEIILNTLKDEGVEYIFGIPGSTETPLLHKLTQTPEIKYILAAHESVCVGMADGYARTSGKVGVVMVHTFPGTCNIIGPLRDALQNGSPILVIAGMQHSRLQNIDPLLDMNLEPAASEVTKRFWKVTDIADLPVILSRAIKEARTLPMGPTFVCLNENLQAQSVVTDIIPAASRRVSQNVRADSDALKKAAGLLLGAKNPIIFAGHEVPDAYAIGELVKLAETLGAPVFTSGESRLIFPTDHPLYFGAMPPFDIALQKMFSTADVALALGASVFKQFRYSGVAFLTPATRLIHVDIDPQGLAKTYPTEIALMANPKAALGELASIIEEELSSAKKEQIAQKAGQLGGIRSKQRAAIEAHYNKSWDAMPIKPWRAYKEIASNLPADAAVINEMVTLSIYVTKIFELPQSAVYYYSSSYLGWGMAAAMGVRLARPGKPVLAMVADGSALFGIQALWTAARYNIPVTLVIINNEGYNAIRGFLGEYSMAMKKPVDSSPFDIGDPHIDRLAQAFGIDARRITDPAQIKPALERALGLGKPALVEIMVDPADPGFRPPQ
ncbi:MAG: thiamine pyrophosphate-binding protein [Dehalococcoidia bacterium]